MTTSPLQRAQDAMREIGDQCVWTRRISHRDLVPYLVEEAAELIEAIETDDRPGIREELGDLLWQVLFHADIASRAGEGTFTLDDVAGDLAEKMIHRHPHVFAGETADTPERVVELWHEAKSAEKRERTSVLDGVSHAMPALALAQKVIQRAGAEVTAWHVAGFTQADDPRRSTSPKERAPGSEAELGEHLLALVATANTAGWDAERALRTAIRHLEQSVQDVESQER